MKTEYERFHGRAPRFAKKLDFHVPKGFVILGKAVAIEYECDKLHGGGDGKMAVYRHEFETDSFVCADERMKKQVYVLGPKIVITEAGIEN